MKFNIVVTDAMSQSSPSLGREWIEILVFDMNSGKSVVSLFGEGVD